MRDTAKLQRNIGISYLFNFFTFFRTTNAIWMLYLGFKGLSLTEIAIMEAIFHVASLIFDVPTGAMADVYGRKISVILSRVAGIIHAYLMISADSMLIFCLASIFCGLSYTLNSGASDAILFDSVCQTDGEQHYRKIWGKISALREVSQAIAVILGGYLADVSFVYAYMVTLLMDIAALVVAGGITEPVIGKKNSPRLTVIEQMQISFKVLSDIKTAFLLILFFSIITAVGTTVLFYCQKYFELMNFSKMNIAIIFTVNSLLRAICVKYSHKIDSKLEMKSILFIFPILVGSGLLGLAVADGGWSLLFFYIISIIDGISYLIFGYYINRLIPSEYRATILSIQSTVFSICMIIFFLLVGLIADYTSLRTAFFTIILLLVPAIMFVPYKWSKVDDRNKII